MDALKDVTRRARSFLQKRARGVLITDRPYTLLAGEVGEVVLEFTAAVGLDFDNGVRIGMLVFPANPDAARIVGLATETRMVLDELGRGLEVIAAATDPAPPMAPLSSKSLHLSPRLLLYSPSFPEDVLGIIHAFAEAGWSAEICDERNMYLTAYIAYGGPDESAAAAIDAALRSFGVRTWFFPRDSKPGQRLHRMMFQGVNAHDRVVFLCSSTSLARTGVLNELEQVLAREAREGGAEILIPVALDNHVFSDWAPSRPELAQQLRDRVIASWPSSTEGEVVAAAVTRIVDALRRSAV